ncbi:MAG: glycosyltransferase [Clostridia bacterium]|nr:glycosyltransferase [Clostridia bacterium]
MDQREITVTVWLSTYNQAPYVREALDSILMQKCDFRYELIAADDASTDGTQDIIREYAEKYPDIVKCFFTDHNVGGCQKLVNCIDGGLFRGRYLAYLEGDDYWIGEDRLQVLVDFLEQHPEYSRVSHKRQIVNDSGEFLGYDVDEKVLGKPFGINDFLEGKKYSDFGSVFRNYFKGCAGKYDELFLASRNVCDFQSMFITQDHGPVFIMDECFGAYRTQQAAGASNYNSITSLTSRAIDHIGIARAVERFYNGKYDLSPFVRRMQKRLLESATESGSAEKLASYKKLIPVKDMRAILPEILYCLYRGHKKDNVTFLKSGLTKEEKRFYRLRLSAYSVKRLFKKLLRIKENEKIIGYMR